MQSAAKLRRVKLGLYIGESYGAPLRVDRDKRTIHNCKLLGATSRNKRRYLPEAIKQAVPLYEGAKVFLNHPHTPLAERSVQDAFGRCVNVREAGGELWGDLEYFHSDPNSAKVIEDAERGMRIFGFSHNADGDTTLDAQGVRIVHRIGPVRSVDLVTRPATTTSLAESATMPERISRAQLLEMGYEMAPDSTTSPATEPAVEPAAPALSWREQLAALAGAIVGDESMDKEQVKTKLMALLKMLEDEGGSSTPATPADDKPADDKAAAESQKLRAENRKFKALIEAQKLCAEANVKPTTALVESMALHETTDGMRALLNEVRNIVHRPRSASPIGTGGGLGAAKSKEDFLKSITKPRRRF